MSKRIKDPAVYIWDMITEMDFIERALEKSNIHDEMTSRAVLRSFTVLGEAAKRVNDETKVKTSEIPWQKIIDTRNFISHEYENVNLQKIEGVVRDHFPSLKQALRQLYHQLTGSAYHANDNA
jgi:uncharacterized protein with HEPN domain